MSYVAFVDEPIAVINTSSEISKNQLRSGFGEYPDRSDVLSNNLHG